MKQAWIFQVFLLLPMALVAVGNAQAQEKVAPRFHLEGGHGRIDVAPTILDRFPLQHAFDREIPDINDGRRSFLTVQWDLDGRWSLRGGYERMQLDYHNPVTVNCPAAVFNVPQSDCNGMFGEWTWRDGEIHDDVDHFWVGLRYQQPFLDWLAGFVEVGYGHMRWQADGDAEALGAMHCSTFAHDPDFAWENVYERPIPVPGCTPVASHAKSDGLVATFGLDVDLPAGFGVALSWHHQGYRHVIYRNQMLPRFNEVNGALCPNSWGCVVPAVYVRQTQSDWDWFQARLNYDINTRLGLFLQAETAGNRAWNVYSGGVRVSF